ncbi:MAG: tetratricopeptide repeat protein, partial [Myxococcota bacterium]
MTRPRLASVVLVLTVTTWAGVAAPAPSIWRRAAAPSTHAAAEMRQRAGDQLDEHVRLGQRAASRSQPQATVAALDGAAQALDGAENHRDPMLRHQMGRVHHYRYQLVSDARELELAIEHFQYVVRHPRTPTTLRASALQTMAVSYARLGRHRDEIEVYDEALTLEPDPDSHAVLLA